MDKKPSSRIASLDQFRGYTVVGMLLVNFMGGFQVCHYVLRHHNTFLSYADTIMPQFLFAVGFAFRLTFNRRVEKDGAFAAYGRVVKRLLGLLLISVVVYTVDRRAESWQMLTQMSLWEIIGGPLKRDWFQTLAHIAVTSLWILPVIRAGATVRIAFMLVSGLAHVVLSHWFYFEWVNSPPNGIDGGPLGFLTWTIPAMAGTLACDLFVRHQHRPPVIPMLFWAAVLMLFGYAMSCGTRFYDRIPDAEVRPAQLAERPVLPGVELVNNVMNEVTNGKLAAILAEPPLLPPPHDGTDIGTSQRYRGWNYWMMSQRAGTLSYLTFGAGFSLAVFALFYVFCDLAGIQIGIFRTFGSNALTAYVVHMMVDIAIRPFLPSDCPAWAMWTGFACFLGITYIFIRALEKQGVFIRM